MSKVKDSITCQTAFKDASGHDCVRREDGSLRVSLSFEGDLGRTEQSHKDSCDISYIISQYVRSGENIIMPEQAVSMFQDFVDMPDYQDCLNMVNSIDDTFTRLPLDVRVAFDHNPALFMNALNDPSQVSKLRDLGVYERIQAQADARVTVSTPDDGGKPVTDQK